MYFAWLSNTAMEGFEPDETLVDEILKTYLNTQKGATP
jgi:hypothetical protein